MKKIEEKKVEENKEVLQDNYLIYAKRKTSSCLLKKGKVPGIFYRNSEYCSFTEYQKQIFNKKVFYDYEEILREFPSIYSRLTGGGFTGSFEAFCSAINKLLKKTHPEVKITTDSRRKLQKRAGGRGARAKRQKSYR